MQTAELVIRLDERQRCLKALDAYWQSLQRIGAVTGQSLVTENMTINGCKLAILLLEDEDARSVKQAAE